MLRDEIEKKILTEKKMQKAYDTRGSQDVSDPSTSQAQRCLTCQIGRDGVFSTRYGRKRRKRIMKGFCEWRSHTRSFLFPIHSLALTSLTVCSLALIAFLLIETERYFRNFLLYFANTTSYSHNLLVAWILLRSLPARPVYKKASASTRSEQDRSDSTTNALV